MCVHACFVIAGGGKGGLGKGLGGHSWMGWVTDEHCINKAGLGGNRDSEAIRTLLLNL